MRNFKSAEKVGKVRFPLPVFNKKDSRGRNVVFDTFFSCVSNFVMKVTVILEFSLAISYKTILQPRKESQVERFTPTCYAIAPTLPYSYPSRSLTILFTGMWAIITKQ